MFVFLWGSFQYKCYLKPPEASFHEYSWRWMNCWTDRLLDIGATTELCGLIPVDQLRSSRWWWTKEVCEPAILRWDQEDRWREMPLLGYRGSQAGSWSQRSLLAVSLLFILHSFSRTILSPRLQRLLESANPTSNPWTLEDEINYEQHTHVVGWISGYNSNPKPIRDVDNTPPPWFPCCMRNQCAFVLDIWKSKVCRETSNVWAGSGLEQRRSQERESLGASCVESCSVAQRRQQDANHS